MVRGFVALRGVGASRGVGAGQGGEQRALGRLYLLFQIRQAAVGRQQIAGPGIQQGQFQLLVGPRRGGGLLEPLAQTLAQLFKGPLLLLQALAQVGRQQGRHLGAQFQLANAEDAVHRWALQALLQAAEPEQAADQQAEQGQEALPAAR